MIQVSQFWLDRAVGKPLGPAWTRKDAAIAAAATWLRDDELQAWMRINKREQLRVLHAAVDTDTVMVTPAGAGDEV